MIVRDIMNVKPAKLILGGRLKEALDLMAAAKERHVVVLDETERVVGIVSDRDLAMYYDPVHMTEEKWDAARVDQLMTRDPVVIGSAADIHSAAQLLLKSAVSALPVVDNGALVGILSEKDFVRHFARKAQAKGS